MVAARNTSKSLLNPSAINAVMSLTGLKPISAVIPPKVFNKFEGCV